MSRHFTLQQAAREARTHTVVIYRAVRSGALHGRPTANGTDWVIRIDCLAAWLDRTPCPCRTQTLPGR